MTTLSTDTATDGDLRLCRFMLNLMGSIAHLGCKMPDDLRRMQLWFFGRDAVAMLGLEGDPEQYTSTLEPDETAVGLNGSVEHQLVSDVGLMALYLKHVGAQGDDIQERSYQEVLARYRAYHRDGRTTDCPVDRWLAYCWLDCIDLRQLDPDQFFFMRLTPEDMTPPSETNPPGQFIRDAGHGFEPVATD